MKTPVDKTIRFVFHSHPVRDLAVRRRAEVEFPPSAGAEDSLAILIADGNGAPVSAGVFEFAGKQIEISGGSGSIGYADFIAGKHEKGVWLYRKGMPPTPGGLTFE